MHDFFTQLSPQSRQQRFLVPRPALNEREISWLLRLEPRSHWSWVAESSEPSGARLIGVAQGFHDRANPGSAEIAVAVLDAFQGQGLGRLLLAVVAAEALAVGIQRLHGYTLADNHRILRYGDRRSAVRRAENDGTVELRFTAEHVAADLPPGVVPRKPAQPAAKQPSEFISRLPLTEGP